MSDHWDADVYLTSGPVRVVTDQPDPDFKPARVGFTAAHSHAVLHIPEQIKFDPEGLAQEMRLTATEMLCVGLDLPLDIVEDQSHITRGEN